MRFLFPNHFTGFKSFHMPAPFRKKTFETIWNEEPELLVEVSRHKFREHTDINQWLAIWWQLAEGNFAPKRMNTKNGLINCDTVDAACEHIVKQAYEMICLNDDVDEVNFPIIAKKLQNAFEAMLPDKCSFEK